MRRNIWTACVAHSWKRGAVVPHREHASTESDHRVVRRCDVESCVGRRMVRRPPLPPLTFPMVLTLELAKRLSTRRIGPAEEVYILPHRRRDRELASPQVADSLGVSPASCPSSESAPR